MYSHGFLKLAASSPKIHLGDSMYNVLEIIKELKNIEKKKTAIVCFPELTITGYSVGDLLFQKSLYEDSLNAIKYLLDNNPFSGAIVLGSYLILNDALYNCAFVIQKKKILGIIPKIFLPHTNEFYETRYFSSGKYVLDKVKTVKLFGEEIPFGKMLFTNKEKDVVFGAETCGDIWAPNSPNELLFANGALIVLNPSASPEYIGKQEKRRVLNKSVTQKFNSAYVYVSNNASESTTDVIFSSHKIISENGAILSEDDVISLETSTIFADVDVSKLHYQRRNNSYYKQSYENSKDQAIQTIEFDLKRTEEYVFENSFEKFPFVPKNKSDYQRILDMIAVSVAKRLDYIGIKSTVLGLSGGLDSTVALLSLCYTYDKFKWDRKDIHVLMLPTTNNSSTTFTNAMDLAKKLGVTSKVIEINNAVKAQLNAIDHSVEGDITYENAQARYRTYTLMNYANLNKGIVIGTSDMSEVALGWSTFNGDQMAMYGVNSGLPKTVIKALLKYQKELFPDLDKVIESVLDTPISPELKNTNQFTEDLIGKYEINDFILYHFLVNGDDGDRLVYLLGETFGLTEVDSKNYVNNFKDRFTKNQYKRLTMPEGVKILSFSMSPRGELRLSGDTYYTKL